MRMVFLCGHCRGKLAADSSHAGSPVKCPRCQAVVEAPAPHDPGYEFVEESEPEPPPPRRDPQPAPRRKSSRHLLRDERPIRRRSGPTGNGTKAALLALLGLAVVAGVVVVALFAFSGKRVDAKKPPGLPDLLGGAGPLVQPDWEWHRGTGYDVLVPRVAVRENGLAEIGIPAHQAGGTEVTVVRGNGFDIILGQQPAPWGLYQVQPGQSAALLARMTERMGGRDVRVLEVSRYPARDFSVVQGGKDAHIRLAVAGDHLVLITIVGVGLRATDEQVRIVRESLKLD